MKLADRADQNGDSLAVFLDFLRENLGIYEKLEDLEILKPELAGVQLMTIHKSKGLEFPLFISGQIDLFFEAQDRAYIIDFKTDRVYREGEYTAQLGLYSLASRELTEKKLSCYLFLLRNGRAIALDDGIDWEERLSTFASIRFQD